LADTVARCASAPLAPSTPTWQAPRRGKAPGMAKKISTETGEVARGRARRAIVSRAVSRSRSRQQQGADSVPDSDPSPPRLGSNSRRCRRRRPSWSLFPRRASWRARLRAASRSPPLASSPPPVPRASPSPRAAAPPSSAVPVRPETRPRPRLRRDRVSPRAVPTAERRATAKTFPSRCIVPRRSLPRLGLPPTPASIHPVPPRRAGEGETEPSEPEPPAPEVKSDPFGFGTSTGEPDKIQPGFDTAEGGKVGPVGTFFISILLIFLFGASFFFTSVPRNAIEGFVDLADDPDAPTNVFR